MFGNKNVKIIENTVQRHQRDIDDIRRVNRNRHRAFRSRFEEIEETQMALATAQNNRLRWQDDAHNEEITNIFDLLATAASNQAMMTEVFATQNRKLEQLRTAINHNAEELMQVQTGIKNALDAEYLFVGDTGQDQMGLTDAVAATSEIAPDQVVPEEIQAFLDFLKGVVGEENVDVSVVEVTLPDDDTPKSPQHILGSAKFSA